MQNDNNDNNDNIHKDMIININGMDITVTGKRKVRVSVGIPVSGGINQFFFHNMLLRVEEWSQCFDIIPIVESTFSIDEARNNIVKSSIENKCDYIFFVDSDVVIQKGQLEKLISWDKDAITGIYYMRIPPYYPLVMKKTAYRLYNPIEPSDTDLINIDGAGLGCFLVKTYVFDKIKFPWFQFKYFEHNGKWRHIGEDLYFCEQLQNAKIDIVCDPTVQCVHIGTQVTIDIAQKYKDLRISILTEMQRSKEELSQFTGLTLEDVTEKCYISTDIVANQYRRDIIELKENPIKFYKENKDYIFDLINWHLQQRRMFDIRLIDEIKNKYPHAKKILDFGSGCGQNTIMLTNAGYDVSMADYEGYTSQFARFRTKKRGLNIKFYDIEKQINDKFDIILALDVFEHIPDEDFEKTIQFLKSLKRNGGKILTTTSFGTQGGTHPMHYDVSQEKIKLIETLNN